MICKLNSQIALQFSFFWQSLSSPGFVLLFSLLLNASQWETNPFYFLNLNHKWVWKQSWVEMGFGCSAILNTFACLVTKPFNRSEAKGDFVMIQTLVLYNVNDVSFFSKVHLKQREESRLFSQDTFLNVAWLRFWHLESKHY